jgi:hypothetical protein
MSFSKVLIQIRPVVTQNTNSTSFSNSPNPLDTKDSPSSLHQRKLPMHFSHLKPSESPSFLDNLRLLLPLLLYTIPQPFPFIKASLKNEIAPFHSLICETLSRRRKRRKKREKMQIFKMFCVANFFSFFREVKVMFCLEALREMRNIWCVISFRRMKVVSEKSTESSLPSVGAQKTNTLFHFWPGQRCNKVDFYVSRLRFRRVYRATN